MDEDGKALIWLGELGLASFLRSRGHQFRPPTVP